MSLTYTNVVQLEPMGSSHMNWEFSCVKLWYDFACKCLWTHCSGYWKNSPSFFSPVSLDKHKSIPVFHWSICSKDVTRTGDCGLLIVRMLLLMVRCVRCWWEGKKKRPIDKHGKVTRISIILCQLCFPSVLLSAHPRIREIVSWLTKEKERGTCRLSDLPGLCRRPMSEIAAKSRIPEDHSRIFLTFIFLFYGVAVVFWFWGVFSF